MVAQRQNPAYRPAKERPRKCGVFLYVRSRGSRHTRLCSRAGAHLTQARAARHEPYTTLGSNTAEHRGGAQHGGRCPVRWTERNTCALTGLTVLALVTLQL